MWLQVAVVHPFCYCVRFSYMNGSQFVYIFTFQKGIWVVASVFNYEQCRGDLPGTCLLGASARVSLQYTAGVASLGQGVRDIQLFTKWCQITCQCFLLPESHESLDLHHLQHLASSDVCIFANQRLTRWQLIVMLICISMIIEIEHLFVFLSAICVSSSV